MRESSPVRPHASRAAVESLGALLPYNMQTLEAIAIPGHTHETLISNIASALDHDGPELHNVHIALWRCGLALVDGFPHLYPSTVTSLPLGTTEYTAGFVDFHAGQDSRRQPTCSITIKTERYNVYKDAVSLQCIACKFGRGTLPHAAPPKAILPSA